MDKEAPPPFRSKSYNLLAAMHMGVAATAFFLPDKVRAGLCLGFHDFAASSSAAAYCMMQVSSVVFEASALNDVLIEPLLQLLSGQMLISGTVSFVLGVRSSIAAHFHVASGC